MTVSPSKRPAAEDTEILNIQQLTNLKIQQTTKTQEIIHGRVYGARLLSNIMLS